MATIFDNLISYIKVTSAYGPDIVLDKPLAPAPKTTKPTFMAVLKPRIEIGVAGGQPLVIQPYGAPPPSRWPWIIGGLGILGGTLVALATVGGREMVRSRRAKKSAP